MKLAFIPPAILPGVRRRATHASLAVLVTFLTVATFDRAIAKEPPVEFRYLASEVETESGKRQTLARLGQTVRRACYRDSGVLGIAPVRRGCVRGLMIEMTAEMQQQPGWNAEAIALR